MAGLSFSVDALLGHDTDLKKSPKRIEEESDEEKDLQIIDGPDERDSPSGSELADSAPELGPDMMLDQRYVAWVQWRDLVSRFQRQINYELCLEQLRNAAHDQNQARLRASSMDINDLEPMAPINYSKQHPSAIGGHAFNHPQLTSRTASNLFNQSPFYHQRHHSRPSVIRSSMHPYGHYRRSSTDSMSGDRLGAGSSKRLRTAFTSRQLEHLERTFDESPYVVGVRRRQLARELGLSETQVKVWFQNRRTKQKRGTAPTTGHDQVSPLMLAPLAGAATVTTQTQTSISEQ